jgi:TolC family type I secretion outer membrane protein
MGDRVTMHRRLLASLVGLGVVATLGTAAPTRAQAPAAPPATVHLSLDEAISLALRQQPQIRSSAQARQAAGARVPQAQSAYYPRFDWLTSAGRSQSFSESLNRPITGNSISTAIQGSQLLYDFGRTSSLVDQARANLEVADTEVDRVQQLVVQNVRQAYFQLLQARRLVGVAQAALTRDELNLRSAQGRFQVGTSPKSDVTAAEVPVANDQVNLIVAHNNVRLAQTTLANAIGLAATTTIEIDDILTYEPVTLDAAALLQEALANRPELKGARAQVEAARAQLRNARAGFLPTLNATGSYGGSSNDPALHEAWSIAGTLSWNLFQGFFTTNQVKETEALVGQAQANYDTLELQVRLDVEQAYTNVVAAAEAITATEKAVESARENLRLAQGRYDAGVGTIIDLTTAQADLTTAEGNQVQALTLYRVGLATLDRVVGRGVAARLP